MDRELALIEEGIQRITWAQPERDRCWSYYTGDHPDLPFAPAGASLEYRTLREMSLIPMTRLAVKTPCQRLRVENIHAKGDRGADSADADARIWKIWQKNKLDSQQRLPYIHSMVYNRGYVSVWPNARDSQSPFVRVEHPDFVWVEVDPRDPLRTLWSVKRFIERRVDERGVETRVEVAWLYLDEWVYPAERSAGGWVKKDRIRNPIGSNPITVFSVDPDGRGEDTSMVGSLIPQQRAIDTLRFDLLLAAQFAAYRQRVATGYDPVIRDENGDPIFHLNEDGTQVLDPQTGMPMPLLSSPGNVGVDRLLAFPGADTKVYDLAESDLKNYTVALEMLIGGFAATAQVPPQYLVGKFDNVGADLMVATEATLLSLLSDMKTNHGESWETVNSKVSVAIGDPGLVDDSSEMDWADATPMGLQQIGDFASKVVPLGFPMQGIVEMLPGATQQKVARIGIQPPMAPAAPVSNSGPIPTRPTGETPNL